MDEAKAPLICTWIGSYYMNDKPIRWRFMATQQVTLSHLLSMSLHRIYVSIDDQLAVVRLGFGMLDHAHDFGLGFLDFGISG